MDAGPTSEEREAPGNGESGCRLGQAEDPQAGKDPGSGGQKTAEQRGAKGQHQRCQGLLQPGTYYVSDCTEADRQSVCKECTEGKDFMDKENAYAECQGCRNCESAAGQEELHPCTITQNTVCKCKEGYFCSEENCNRCHECTLCDNGIAEECTSTNNTVCKNFSGRRHAIVWSILGVVFGAIITFVVCMYKRKKCRRTSENMEIPDSEPFIPPKQTCPPKLENIELDNHLFEIASLMGQESVQKLVTKQLSTVVQEEVRIDNRNNAREEKFELLKKWYNAHGHQGAFKMLIENCTKGEAEKIIDFVQKENAEP